MEISVVNLPPLVWGKSWAFISTCYTRLTPIDLFERIMLQGVKEKKRKKSYLTEVRDRNRKVKIKEKRKSPKDRTKTNIHGRSHEESFSYSENDTKVKIYDAQTESKFIHYPCLRSRFD